MAKELGENMTDDELKEMIGEADSSGKGEVKLDDFFAMLQKTSLYGSGSAI